MLGIFFIFFFIFFFLCLGFQIELVLHAHSILKSRIWFQPKLYSTQFNYHYKLYVYIYNIYIYIYIVTDPFIFSRITCLRVFIQSYMLLNIIENTKGKYQFGELKSCYPMTTWRWLDFSISDNGWPCQQHF